MLVFEEKGKPEYQRKTSRSKDKNQQQTRPTYDAKSVNWTWATFIGGRGVLSPLHHPCFLLCDVIQIVAFDGTVPDPHAHNPVFSIKP